MFEKCSYKIWGVTVFIKMNNIYSGKEGCIFTVKSIAWELYMHKSSYSNQCHSFDKRWLLYTQAMWYLRKLFYYGLDKHQVTGSYTSVGTPFNVYHGSDLKGFSIFHFYNTAVCDYILLTKFNTFKKSLFLVDHYLSCSHVVIKYT